MKKFALRTLPFVVAWAIAIYLTPTVVKLAQYTDVQTHLYDQAIDMARNEDPKIAGQALQVFMESYKVFKGLEPKTWAERYLLPQGDQEMAALAMFHVGNMLRAANKNEDALKAYVESLRLNAGQRMLLGVSARDDGSHQYARDFCVTPGDKVGMARPVNGDDCQLLRLEKQADDTRNNLLSLLSEHPELAKLLEEPGKLGPPGQGPGKPGNGQPMPGDDTGKQPGQDNNDAI
jgi:hypothetical protein